jgi:hypothetical protein
MMPEMQLAVFYGLDMLAIQHEFAVVFENLIGRAVEAHVGTLGRFFEIGFNGVDRVVAEHRLDEKQFVIAVAEGVHAVGGDDAETRGEDKRTSHKALAEDAFFLREDFVGDVGVHIQHERVELHALTLGNRAADRADLVADDDVFIEPILGIPDGDG